MNRIEKLIDRLNALTGEDYEIHNWGRGDWSLYNGDNEVTNTLSAAIMERHIRDMIRDAANTSKAAAALGRKGGKMKSAAKAAAARANGAKGGRPRKAKTHDEETAK